MKLNAKVMDPDRTQLLHGTKGSGNYVGQGYVDRTSYYFYDQDFNLMSSRALG